jgi:HSP20 family protein
MYGFGWSGMGRPWSGWSDLRRLQDEVNRLVGNFRGPGASWGAEFPAVNVWTKEDGAVLTAEVPGLKAEDIDISVTGSSLTIRGERKPETTQGEYHRREREAGSFVRAIDLPFRIDAERVEASFAHGVLTLTLPRAEADKPRKISVTGS